jgi:hypothetical protein
MLQMKHFGDLLKDTLDAPTLKIRGQRRLANARGRAKCPIPSGFSGENESRRDRRPEATAATA